MEKNFLNITPESGNGNQEVTVNAKANISLEDREEMLRIRSSTGKEASVRIIQDGVPFYTASLIKFSGYPKNVGTLDFIPYFNFVNVGTNDDGSNYPIYNCKIKMNSNYDFSSDIKYFLMCTFRADLLEDYKLELETPSESRSLTLKSSVSGLGLKNYEGEIFLSNGTGIVDEVSLRLTNKSDAYDYRTLYQIVFN